MFYVGIPHASKRGDGFAAHPACFAVEDDGSVFVFGKHAALLNEFVKCDERVRFFDFPFVGDMDVYEREGLPVLVFEHGLESTYRHGVSRWGNERVGVAQHKADEYQTENAQHDGDRLDKKRESIERALQR